MAKQHFQAIEPTKTEPETARIDSRTRVIVVYQDNGSVVCSPRLTLTEAACQISGSLVEAVKQLLTDCSIEELDTINQWLLNQKARRERSADSPADAVTTKSVATKERD